MSKSNVLTFLEEAHKNDDLNEITTLDGIIAAGHSAGYEFTEDEFLSGYQEYTSRGDAELTDAELEAVAGGAENAENCCCCCPCCCCSSEELA